MAISWPALAMLFIPGAKGNVLDFPGLNTATPPMADALPPPLPDDATMAANAIAKCVEIESDAESHGGFVYLLGGDGGTVKIGFSGDPRERCRQLRNGSGRDLTIQHLVRSRHAAQIERVTHERLKGFRAQGEWFKISVEDARAEILRVAAAFSDGFDEVEVGPAFSFGPHTVKAPIMSNALREQCQNKGLLEIIKTEEARKPRRATGFDTFIAEMMDLCAGGKLKFRTVAISYAAYAKEHDLPEMKDKSLSLALSRCGCKKHVSRRIDGERPTIIEFPQRLRRRLAA